MWCAVRIVEKKSEGIYNLEMVVAAGIVSNSLLFYYMVLY